MQTEAKLQIEIKNLLKLKSLRRLKIENFPWASLGTLARIRDGDSPKKIKLRKKFNLLPIVNAPACSRCGGVHTHKCRQPKPKRKIVVSKDLAKMIWWTRYLKKHFPIIEEGI